jgi:hypothetical protein
MKAATKRWIWKAVKLSGWTALVGGLSALTYKVARFSWLLWVTFPPTDATEAWAALDALGSMVGGIGALWVGLIALRGLRSLWLTRTEMESRAHRERSLCAIQRLEEVAQTLVPKNTPILDGMVAGNVKTFLNKTDTIQFKTPPSEAELASAQAWVDALAPALYNQIVHLLNRLEAWSVYFTKGVADEEVAFEPMAPLLRSWVGQYYAVLLVLRTGSKSGTYPNLVKLFTLWSAKMDAAQLARTYGDMTDQLKGALERVAQAKLPKTGPDLDG